VSITHRLAPAWTTDWISEAGKRKLRAYGIAPPGPAAEGAQAIRIHARNVPCPHCASPQTERLSAFGSTACKALYRCLACREPFEHFKPI
jgi:ring-1,2-phenylacetyl-CoA epoxidase subunit PaaD